MVSIWSRRAARKTISLTSRGAASASTHSFMAPGQLAAGRLHVAPAASADGDEAAELVETGGEGLEALLGGLAEGGLGVLVHRDQVDGVAVAQLAQPGGQAVGVLQGIVDPGEHHVLEEQALVLLELPGVEGLAQAGEV